MPKKLEEENSKFNETFFDLISKDNFKNTKSGNEEEFDFEEYDAHVNRDNCSCFNYE